MKKQSMGYAFEKRGNEKKRLGCFSEQCRIAEYVYMPRERSQ